MDFLKLLSSRHSVRDFLPDAVPPEVLSEILEAGRIAPSSQNRQPWRYIVFRNRERIRELAQKTGLIGLSNFFIKEAPLVIIACAEMKKNLRVNKQDYYLVDTAISFHQMILCAHSHGLGTCWMAAFSQKTLAKYLEIPKSWRIVALSPFGYPKGEKKLYTKALSFFGGGGERLALEDIVIYKD
ncbi:MAG: nitroreductase family protein [Candidatus Cloacimonetes bacterium]|nr:nitroreductase family protein [Candidatus Cloacimonadota bacterium]